MFNTSLYFSELQSVVCRKCKIGLLDKVILRFKFKKMKKQKRSFLRSFLKSGRSILRALPLVFGIVLLMGLFKAYIPTTSIKNVFRGNVIIDTFIGALAGSIFAGHSSTSYIMGGELFKNGISLFAILAFLIAWDTIGLTHIPMEISYFGKKFTLARNFLCFVFSILVAIFATLTLNIL